MRRTVLYGSRVLAAYFIALPLLLGLHSIQHQHPKGFEKGNLQGYPQFTADCATCDLFHSQVSIVSAPAFNDVGAFSTPLESGLPKNHPKVIQGINCLRGPPGFREKQVTLQLFLTSSGNSDDGRTL